MDRPADPFAVAVIRAWMEPGVPGSLRIRVIRRSAGATLTDTIGVTSEIPEACRMLDRWLHEFVDTNDPVPDVVDP